MFRSEWGGCILFSGRGWFNFLFLGVVGCVILYFGYFELISVRGPAAVLGKS